MSKISSPHDKFFKEIFLDKENAIDFINGIFPKQLKDKLNLNTLALDNNSYINEELEEHYSDIVYNCEYNNHDKIKISLLFEHKSYFVKYPRIQILKYMLKIWETCIKQNNQLTPVIPVIIYHGKEKWNSKSLSEYFNNMDDTLKKYIPDFEHLLADLSSYSNEEIKDILFHRVSLETAFLIMKNIFNEDVLKAHLEDFLHISKLYFDEEKGLKFLQSLILYLYNAGDLKKDFIIEKIAQISIKGGEAAMSTASRLMEEGELKGYKEGIEKGIEKGIEEGIEKGIEKGVQKGIMKGIEKGKILESQEILIKFLKSKFGSVIVNKDIELINSVNDINKLKDALEVLLSANNKDTVLMKLK